MKIMKLFRNILVFSLFIYSFTLPSFAQEAMDIDLELSKLMETEHVGESNIRTRELYTLFVADLELGYFLNDIRRQYTCDIDIQEELPLNDTCYHIYDVSFLANGQQKSLILAVEESREHSSSEILQEVRAVLGKMPERWLSEVHFIKIKKEIDPYRSRGEFLSSSSSFIPDFNERSENTWLQQMFPQLSPRVINDDGNGIVYLIYNTIQVNFYYDFQDARYRARATQTMRHELGHLIATSGSGYSSEEWHDAIVRDGTSAYGRIRSSEDDRDFDIEQDFAHTVAIYLTTYRGFYDNVPFHPEPKIKYRHRFAILDRIMGIDEMKKTLNNSQKN